ncbi:hypothetical protein NC651_018370 [Populus alba x Populus x berolinensis]|nr:hypothetical protein NC651_018370 [Populus alba x Populus x berolinensis]
MTIKQLIEDLTMEKEKRKRLRIDIGNSQSLFNDEVEEGDSANPILSDIDSQANKRLTMQGTCANRKKTTLFVPRNTPNSQPNIKSAVASKEKEYNARKVIARWWYDVNVPFNGVKSYYYQPMIDVIASMKPGFKGPSYHDLRGPLLKGVVHDVHEYLFEIKADWKLYGCSIMADGWSNRRNVSIVNFLAYSPRALMRKDFTNVNDIIHPSITRFATHFLSIQCLLKFKKELQQMFTCMKCVESSHGKSKVGKEISAIILQDKDFWPRCEYIVKVSEPLVRVLRLADSKEKPAMGYYMKQWIKQKKPSRQG